MGFRVAVVAVVFAVLVVTYIAFYDLAQNSNAQPSAGTHQVHSHSPAKSQSTPLVPEPAHLDNLLLDSQLLDLQFLPNNKLIDALKVFWRNCQLRQNCEELLKKIEDAVAADRYEIIAQYPEKLKTFNQSMQQNVSVHNESIEQKIATIKSVYDSIWGPEAEQLFHRELAFYDQHVQLRALYLDNQNLDLEQKLEVFKTWLGTPQVRAESGPAAYELARLFFSRELASQPGQALALELANNFLSEDQAAAEARRLNRREFQNKQASNYQGALLELRKALKLSRQLDHSNLSDSDWLKHREQKIREFKTQFFQQSAR